MALHRKESIAITKRRRRRVVTNADVAGWKNLMPFLCLVPDAVRAHRYSP